MSFAPASKSNTNPPEDEIQVGPRSIAGLPTHVATSSKPFHEVEASESRKEQTKQLQSMNALDRHRHLMALHTTYYGSAQLPVSEPKTDLDVLKEEYRFIRTAEDDAGADKSWEKQLARKYYNQLFREYCLGDFSKYKDGKVGLRWRTKEEVVAGKGHFVCGSLACSKRDSLHSFEVNFGYLEAGVKKNALVKIRLCPKCAKKLHYPQRKARKEKRKLERAERKRRREERKQKKKERKRDKRHSSASSSSSDSSSSSSFSSDSDSESDNARKHRRKRKERRDEDDKDSGDKHSSTSSSAKRTKRDEAQLTDDSIIQSLLS